MVLRAEAVHRRFHPGPAQTDDPVAGSQKMGGQKMTHGGFPGRIAGPKLPQGRPERLARPSPDKLPPPGPDTETQLFDLFSTPDQDSIGRAYSLPNKQAPTLQRPVLLVHGFNGSAASWRQMRTWLTKNPANTDGGVVHAGSSVNGKGKVFTMEFARPYNSVRTNSKELRSAIDQIVRATGALEIDVVAHSKGGLDNRAYIDEGSEKVKKFVIVGTPNHGSVLADVELHLRELGVPLYPKTDDGEVRQALNDLREDRVGKNGPNNPLLHDLNKNWTRQCERADILLISGNGIPTLRSKSWLTFKGDGVVARSSVEMPNVPMKNVKSTNHFGLRSNPEVLTAAANFLVGKFVELRDDDSALPSDKEITTVQVAANTGQVQYTYEI